jgi:hypothetical protein
MPMEGRAKGWLSELHHARFREVVLHAAIRYQGACPVYCLMPDHGHLLLLGLAGHANLGAAATLIRKEWNAQLQPLGVILQRQAYDHVLRPSERRPGGIVGASRKLALPGQSRPRVSVARSLRRRILAELLARD